MALIVEDGTGKADAETYISLAGFKTYCARRNRRYEDYIEPHMEAALIDATAYLDGRYLYKGARKLATQALEFPRTGLVDRSGHTISGVPLRVAHACCELALKKLENGASLFEDLDRGGQVVSETVGPISTTYAEGAPATTVYTVADDLLSQYIIMGKEGRILMGPQWVNPPSSPAQFSMGMNDAVFPDDETT